MKKSKLSISNLLVIIFCIGTLLSILVLNSINSKNLITIRESFDTLTVENPNIKLLQETETHLSIAENNYRLYLSNYSTNYRDTLLTQLNIVVTNLLKIQSTKDSTSINAIILRFENKLQLSDLILQLKKVEELVILRSKQNDAQWAKNFNGPVQVKMIDKSVIERFISSSVDTLKAAPKKRKDFLKNLEVCFRIKKKNKNCN